MALKHSSASSLSHTPTVQALLFFKGYQSIQAHRIAHALWHQGRRWMALQVQSSVSEKFGVDIHPAALIGCRVMIDHATGVVIGETARVGEFHVLPASCGSSKMEGARRGETERPPRLLICSSWMTVSRGCAQGTTVRCFTT